MKETALFTETRGAFPTPSILPSGILMRLSGLSLVYTCKAGTFRRVKHGDPTACPFFPGRMTVRHDDDCRLLIAVSHTRRRERRPSRDRDDAQVKKESGK